MKKRRLVIIVSALMVGGAAYILGWSTLFTVSAVEIKGTDVALPSGVVKGEKLARVEPRIVARVFEKNDWVKSATVSRNWITGKVSITITERTPIAIYNNLAIDAQGASFMIRNKDVAQLPKIQAPNVDSAIIAAAFFRQLPTDIAAQVRMVKAHSGDTFFLELVTKSGNLELRWGRSEENALKAKVYRALLLQPENKNLKRVDVSAPHAPIVK
jgi:cell division septal protein FtsQ